jgi:short-subunit dehydrogenase
VTLVVLTGATRGIGRAAAVELARQGVDVALVGRDADRVSAVAAQARGAGGGAQVHEHVADLTLMSEVRTLAAEAIKQQVGEQKRREMIQRERSLEALRGHAARPRRASSERSR